jgi:hypothetical protein
VLQGDSRGRFVGVEVDPDRLGSAPEIEGQGDKHDPKRQQWQNA